MNRLYEIDRSPPIKLLNFNNILTTSKMHVGKFYNLLQIINLQLGGKNVKNKNGYNGHNMPPPASAPPN
jgi:hypothetical protein